jgi:Na+-transporting NADH:ubiquinone oxidoreductase subunit A
MAEVKKIKKGLDICLYGKASDNVVSDTASELFAVCPDDYPGYVWKLCVQVGDSVLKGGPLMHDKNKQQIFLCSPVSGVVTEIIRGERRKIEAVVIKSDGSTHEKEFKTPQSCQDLIDLLCQSGLWAMMRQRPYDIIPDPDVRPRDIFVTAFDSAPLAPEMISSSDYGVLEEGLKALRSLTDGKVYLGVKFGSGISSSAAIVTEFVGPHPAGNISTQLNVLSPINKGEKVWYCYAQDLVALGNLFLTGNYDSRRVVAFTGSEVKERAYYQTRVGADMSGLYTNIVSENVRIISGNVLTGKKINDDNFLGFYDTQITVIPEGDHYQLFGWLAPNFKKFTSTNTMGASLCKKRSKVLDTNLNGGIRPLIMTGNFERVFPFDIYPMQLIKACIIKDIDQMEELGIYEIDAEDFALCEVIDASKTPIQQIIREGLELLRKEMN